MRIKYHVIVVILTGLLMFLTSCMKDSDFNSSVNKLPLATIESDLIVSSLEASSFIDASQRKEVIFHTDTLLLENMNSEFYMGQLIKTHLSFKFINTLERDFTVDFEFINNDNVFKHTLQVPISSGSIEMPIAVEANVSIKEQELNAFKEATKMVYKITLPPSKSSLAADSKGKISLLSKATHFYEM